MYEIDGWKEIKEVLTQEGWEEHNTSWYFYTSPMHEERLIPFGDLLYEIPKGLEINDILYRDERLLKIFSGPGIFPKKFMYPSRQLII